MFDFSRIAVTPEEIRERSMFTVLAKYYRLTPEEYQEQFTKQGGGCAICGRVDPDKRLAVDHNHGCCPAEKKACGKCVRGLLCQNCNQVLGKFKEDLELFLKAAEYLRFWRDNPRPERLPIKIPHGNKNRIMTEEACRNMSVAHKTDGTLEFASKLGRSNVESGLLARIRTPEHQTAAARAPRPKSRHNWHVKKGISDSSCPLCPR